MTVTERGMGERDEGKIREVMSVVKWEWLRRIDVKWNET